MAQAILLGEWPILPRECFIKKYLLTSCFLTKEGRHNV